MTITLDRALAATAIALLTAGPASAQEATLRVQHFLPAEATVPRLFIEPWAEKVEADSGGRIAVEVYPAMQLGGQAPALYDQIRDGVIDGGWTLPAYTPGRFPEAEAFELPFMTSMSAEDSSRALWEFGQAHLMERMGDIHVCALHVHGPGVIHTKGEAVDELTDFEGLKLRGPSRQANALLEALGAEPVGMPVPAFPEALSRGVVDGGVIPMEVVPSLKVEELTGHHTKLGGDRALYNATFVWGLNKAKVESLPDDLRAVIDANCGLETSAWVGRAMDEGDRMAEGAIAARGNAIHTLDDEAVGELRAIGEAQTEAWIEEVTAKGLDGRALVDDARALVEKHAGGAS